VETAIGPSPAGLARPTRRLCHSHSAPGRMSDGEDSPLVRKSRERSDSDETDYGSLSLFGLVCVTFVTVAGGPYGIETAVGAAGPFPTIVALCVLTVTWQLPQALVTAELSTMFPSNAGYVGWVTHGLGPFWGCINAWNSMLSNLFDIPIYPVLVGSYAAQVLGVPRGGMVEVVIKVLALCVVVSLNLAGIEVVSLSSAAFATFVMAPFVAQLFMVDLEPSGWMQSSPAIEWAPFLAALLWSIQGFDSLGCVAGEVRNASRTYPTAVTVAAVLITINYLVPILVGTSVEPNYTLWGSDEDGKSVDLAVIGSRIAPWMGVWVLLSATVANLSEFSAIITTASRALQHTAELGMAPSFLRVAHRNKDTTPVVAILTQAAVAACLMWFDFSELVVFDTFFNNVSLLLEVVAFLVMKHSHPRVERPFEVPWGLFGAYLVSVPKTLVILYAMFTLTTSSESLVQLYWGLGVNLVFMGGAWVWIHWTHHGRDWHSRCVASTDKLLSIDD
jgi:amino acid transporter